MMLRALPAMIMGILVLALVMPAGVNADALESAKDGWWKAWTGVRGREGDTGISSTSDKLEEGKTIGEVAVATVLEAKTLEDEEVKTQHKIQELKQKRNMLLRKEREQRHLEWEQRHLQRQLREVEQRQMENTRRAELPRQGERLQGSHGGKTRPRANGKRRT